VRLAPSAGRIEHRQGSPCTLVEKGAALGILVPARRGRAGTRIKGLAILYIRTRIRRLKPGKSVEHQDRRFLAACDGRFAYDHFSFRVSEFLEARGDDDCKTGSNDFPGNVLIHGEVKGGCADRGWGPGAVSRPSAPRWWSARKT